jgi:hypothetical protein
MKYCAELDKMIKKLKILKDILQSFNIKDVEKEINDKISFLNILRLIFKCEMEFELTIGDIFKKIIKNTTIQNANPNKIEKAIKLTENNIDKNFETTKNDIEQYIDSLKNTILDFDIEKINNIYILEYILQNFKLDNNTKQKIENKIKKLEERLKSETKQCSVSQMGNSNN